jgi:hypothetical protein
MNSYHEMCPQCVGEGLCGCPSKQVGSISFTYDDKLLVKEVAAALRASGRTCDEDSWSEVMALEAVNCLRRTGALK